jgi:hypothetical protein
MVIANPLKVFQRDTYPKIGEWKLVWNKLRYMESKALAFCQNKFWTPINYGGGEKIKCKKVG